MTATARQPETIVAAAIRLPVPEEYRNRHGYPDKLTITAPPPARHGTLMHPSHGWAMPVDLDDQGFITSSGRYVDRVEAMQIAVASGQPMRDQPFRSSELFSEDLW